VFDLLRISSTETKIVLGLTAVLSLISWFLIGFKGWQLRRIRRRSERFFLEVERAAKLQDAYRMAMKLPQSPFNRLFREGMSFYTELHPGAFKEGPRERITMAPSQLEALKMILGKEVAAERDRAARFVPWLATIGSVSPLMGLLGTVLGVMDAFLGISSHGSGNIASVAPGVAEALITTVAGLAAAIPAVMAYNYFSSKINEFESELEGFGYSLIGWLAREGLL
jgi:biopolymer transport protein TolQ